MFSRSRAYSIFISSFLGVVFSLLLSSSRGGGEFWYVLHDAQRAYINIASAMAGFAIPAFVLFGILSSAIMSRRGGASRAEKGSVWRTTLLLVLFILPALHWLAVLSFFLIASRYSDKAASILAGAFHVFMLATSITVALSTAYGHRWRNALLYSYVAVALTAALLLAFRMPVGVIHLQPFIRVVLSGLALFVANNASLLNWTVVSTFLVVYGLLVGCAQMCQRTAPDTAIGNGRSTGSSRGGLIETNGVLREANLLLVGSLCLLAYFFSSQFDIRPTTPFTHSLLLVLTVLSVTSAVLMTRFPKAVRTCFVLIAVPLLAIELMLLVALHFTAERDQMTLMAILVGFIAVCVAGELTIFGRTVGAKD